MASVLITGVSSGIGHALANLTAGRGWTTTGTVRDATRRPEGLDERVGLELLDLSVPGSATELAARVLADKSCPDVIVNNAGLLIMRPLEETSAEELERIYQVNVFGQLELVRGFLPAMRERGSGTVANVTSLGGRTVFPFFGAYNSTKWALEAASEALWHELKPWGIRVKAIEPGYVATPIWGKALPQASLADIGAGEEDPYAPYIDAMLAFERAIPKRSSAEKAAAEILSVITDNSDRLRYPVAAYARALLVTRRLLGDQLSMRLFHERWMGRSARQGETRT
jgi:NAD(P)-dependent dehydrogenase (short-subunit alcohol dehydrogenase family)